VEAIRASKAVLVVFGQHSNDSRQVVREMECAVGKRLPLIPVRIADVMPIEDTHTRQVEAGRGAASEPEVVDMSPRAETSGLGICSALLVVTIAYSGRSGRWRCHARRMVAGPAYEPVHPGLHSLAVWVLFICGTRFCAPAWPQIPSGDGRADSLRSP